MITNKGFSLSSSHYKTLDIPNKNVVELRELIKKPVRGKDQESIDFISRSQYLYVKTKAIKDNSFIVDVFSNGCFEFLKPQAYKKSINSNNLLNKEDILYCSSGGKEIGDVAIILDIPDSIIYSSHSFKIISNEAKLKYYLLAFLKSKFCKEQLNYMVHRGATLRRGGDKFLALKIPMPNHNSENTIQFIELLTQAIINKERLIKQRHQDILQVIETELVHNQKPSKFKYELPRIKEIEEVGRLDTGLYCEKFKKITFFIKNYKLGSSKIYDLGFNLSRGQNLQESNIGKSVYSNEYYKNFYSLALPTNFSNYGTVDKIIYLGNPNALKILKKGEIIFGAEGTFRSIVICEEKDNFITNIHGITFYNSNPILSIFIKCFMDYLTKKGIVDCIKVGGHGGSLAQKYWDIIPFPNFPKDKQKEIALLYHNPENEYKTNVFTLDNFLKQDNAFNKKAGINELDKTAKQLKEILNKAIDGIVNDREVKISFK